MAEPRSKSELDQQLQTFRQLRDRLFVERRQLARKLAKLALNQPVEEHDIFSELARVIRERQQAEVTIAGIRLRLDTLSAEESGGRGQADRQKQPREKWYHTSPPDVEDTKFKYPLEENGEILNCLKKDLARWMGITGPTLEKRNKDGIVYVCKSIHTGFQICFASKEQRSDATVARLKEEHTRPQ
jgi:hypothetical protein